MRYIAILLLLTGYGCASLSESECKKGDWENIGLRDGQEGRDSFSRHSKACEEYGISPDAHLYKNGYSRGIKIFCKAENGYWEGKKGGYYNPGTCPSSMESAFRKNFRIGKKIYELERELASSQSSVDSFEKKLDDESYSREERTEFYRQLKDERRKSDKLKKKLIFLKVKSGYETEEVVDLF